MCAGSEVGRENGELAHGIGGGGLGSCGEVGSKSGELEDRHGSCGGVGDSGEVGRKGGKLAERMRSGAGVGSGGEAGRKGGRLTESV